MSNNMGITKATIDGQIISQTLDKVNMYQKQNEGSCKYSGQSMSDMYDFNKSVLSSAYSAKGAIFSGQS